MWLIQKSPTTMWLIPKSPTTMWLIQKSPTMMWLIPKPATMRHYLQSPLRRSTIYKNHYDATLFTKFVATQRLKVRCYTAILYEAQILIWHLFSQSPNSYLASIFTKPKFLFGIYFHKAQIPIWHLFS